MTALLPEREFREDSGNILMNAFALSEDCNAPTSLCRREIHVLNVAYAVREITERLQAMQPAMCAMIASWPGRSRPLDFSVVHKGIFDALRFEEIGYPDRAGDQGFYQLGV